jgi:16S rRNA (cytosine1402-N4)-methyltransferase
MVNEVLAYLRCRDWADESSPEARRDAVFVDGTLGTAGHTLAMLQAHPTCRVVAFDRDVDSMEYARQRLEAAGVAQRVTLVQGDFRDAPKLLQPFFENQKVGADGRPITQIDGALVDAGMSLFQVTWPERGLSFRADAPLDMRYDRSQEISAFDLVNRLSTSDLEDLLFKFSDERWARRIATTIADYRRSHVIRTTGELVSLIEAAIPVAVRRQSRVHPATKTFAALRLAVNDEFWALDHGAWALSLVLAPAARLVILTYSSHEDRTIKRTFRRLAGRAVHSDMGRSHRKKKPEKLSPSHRDSRTARSPLTFSLALPTDVTDEEPAVPEWAAGFGTQWSMKIVTNTPVQPTPEEIAANPLARSCKLRAAEKVVHEPIET